LYYQPNNGGATRYAKQAAIMSQFKCFYLCTMSTPSHTEGKLYKFDGRNNLITCNWGKMNFTQSELDAFGFKKTWLSCDNKYNSAILYTVTGEQGWHLANARELAQKSANEKAIAYFATFEAGNCTLQQATYVAKFIQRETAKQSA
jgi:hypothetical protein